MQRGTARRSVFVTDDDRRDYLSVLREVVGRSLAEVHAYCILGNHGHLLLRTPRTDLDPAVRFLGDTFARRHRARHGGCRPVFEAPCRCVQLRAGRHLVEVSRYLHRNPVEAGLVQAPGDWPFSSYRAYLDPAESPDWLVTATILGYLGSVGARERYRRLVEEDARQRTDGRESPKVVRPGNSSKRR